MLNIIIAIAITNVKWILFALMDNKGVQFLSYESVFEKSHILLKLCIRMYTTRNETSILMLLLVSFNLIWNGSSQPSEERKSFGYLFLHGTW